MATTVTVKGQVTLPKAVRDAAGIRPGDRVNVRARAEGGIIVERETPCSLADAVERKKQMIDRAVAALRLGDIDRTLATDQWMQMLRGED